MDFKGFPKMARLSREIIVTEKIDGTNAQIYITDDGQFLIGKRTSWITPENDNFGFAAWAMHNKEELMQLGPGQHFGEWYGQGIQRKYGLKEKRFVLFNTTKWGVSRPSCCEVVPVLYQGVFDQNEIDHVLFNLKHTGSVLVPGFKDPEGIIIYHTAAGVGFKKTIKDDEVPKGLDLKLK
jgi:hypothetical protein